MKPKLRFVASLFISGVWLVGCSLQPPRINVRTYPAPTQVQVPVPTESPINHAPDPPAVLPHLVTFADNEQTITLRIGERFALELGPSAGSAWLIQVTPPDLLDPPIHQLGPAGSRVLLEPVKTGETVISANSHAICERHGPCPEVLLFFALNVRVIAH